MTDRELMQMALDALEDVADDAEESHKTVSAIKALRAALANEFNPDWDRVEALQESLREHMAEIQRLRARLAQPEPEPVAWKDAPTKIYLQICDDVDCDLSFEAHDDVSWCQDKINDCDVAYVRADTAPPKKKWQGLTDDEIENCFEMSMFGTCRAIEAKLKEKNGF